MIDPTRYRGREQTFVKHFFLDRYLERVAYVTLAGSGRWSEFAYIDAFSGPWRSADENFEDTSVSIALTKLEAVRQGLQKTGRDVTFRALFVERDRSAFQDLQRLVAQFPNSGARTICGEFQDHIAYSTEVGHRFQSKPAGDSTEAGRGGVIGGVMGSGYGGDVKSVALGNKLSHAFSFQVEAVSIMDEAVEDGVSQGWIADHIMPPLDGYLTGDDG